MKAARSGRATTVRSADAVVRGWLTGLAELPVPGIPEAARPIQHGADCHTLAWAACGGMALTGSEDGPPSGPPPGLPPLLDAVSAALARLGPLGIRNPVHIDPLRLVMARAGFGSMTGKGTVSASGPSRLLRAADGWCALTLSRPDDIELLPALLECAKVYDPWTEVTAAVRGGTAADFVARARLLGLPAAALPAQRRRPGARPWRTERIAEPRSSGFAHDRPLVVDLSSLWAGPLCADLLHRAGARVVKVESTRRPDGARTKYGRFYDLLHAGHESVAVDFTTLDGRVALRRLLTSADVVIEASRPRALRHLGLAPEQLSHGPGKVWISITGYGRARSDRVAFGDDAAVAGGLVGWGQRGPVFCADAVADPLTGMVAALGALASLAAGGGHLVDVSMQATSAAFAGTTRPGHGPHPIRATDAGWLVHCSAGGHCQLVLPPMPPEVRGTAPALGTHTARVLAELGQ